MAKVVFELEADATKLSDSLNRVQSEFKETANESNSINSNLKKNLKEIEESAKKANKELSDPRPTKNQKDQLTAIQALKKDIRDYTNAALEAGEGTEEFTRNIKLAGEAKADLRDLQDAIKALDPDAVAQGFLGLSEAIAGGFAVAQGAIGLAGSESKELEKTLLKVQSAQAILSGIQSLANTADELAKVKIIALNKINIAQKFLEGAAESKNIIIRNAATAAQWALNAAMSAGAGPILLIVGASAALGTALLTMGDAAETAEEKQSRLNQELENSKKILDSLKSVNDKYVELLESQGASEEVIVRTRAASRAIAIKSIDLEIEASDKAINAKKAEINTKLRESVIYTTEQDILDQRKLNQDLKNLEVSGEELENKRRELFLNFKVEDAKRKAETQKKDDESNKEALRRQKEFYEALEDLRKKAAQSEIDNLTGQAKILAVQAEELREFEVYKKGLEAKGKLQQEQYEQLAIIENSIRLKAAREISKLEQDELNLVNEKIKSDFEAKLKLRDDNLEKELKSLRDSNKARVLLSQENSKERLDLEILAIESERDFKLKNYKLTSDERIIIEQEALNEIKKLREEFSAKKEFDLFKLLGIDVSEKDKQRIIQSVGSLYNSIKSIVDIQLNNELKALDDRKKINDEIVKSREDTVKSLESQLKTEEELNKAGFASNLKSVRESLDNEKKLRDKALEEQRVIAAEQEKIKKQQVISDSLLQASQLASATASLFAQGAFSGPVGIITAIATVGSMIAFFLSVKEKLKGFEKGGYTGEYGTSEVAGVVHGREFVSTAETTRQHRPLLEALHNNDYSKLTTKDLLPLLNGSGISLLPDFAKKETENIDIEKSKKETETVNRINQINELNSNFKSFFDYYKNKPNRYNLPDGSLVEDVNGNKKIYRNG